MSYFNHLPNITLGYHGCERAIGESILSGERDISESSNNYDWLGPGAYFWEHNPSRAYSFAQQKKSWGTIEEPFVIGAALTLGNCIDTLSENSIKGINLAHQTLVSTYKAAGLKLPGNTGGSDRLFKALDCAVIQALHAMLDQEGEASIDSLRGLYHEGEPIYDTSGFFSKSHIQICITNLRCIKGFFRVDTTAFAD